MEVESCHVSSGGISWRSLSVYRHKIFIYHLQHVLKMRYEAAAIVSGYQWYTSKIYLFWNRFVNIYSDTIFSRQIFLLWLPSVWEDAGSVFSVHPSKYSLSDPLQSPYVRIFMRNIPLVVSAAHPYLGGEGFCVANDWKRKSLLYFGRDCEHVSGAILSLVSCINGIKSQYSQGIDQIYDQNRKR